MQAKNAICQNIALGYYKASTLSNKALSTHSFGLFFFSASAAVTMQMQTLVEYTQKKLFVPKRCLLTRHQFFVWTFVHVFGVVVVVEAMQPQ